MFDYNQIVQSRQRHEEIAKRANMPEPEGWTHPVPNIFDKLFARLRMKRTDRSGTGQARSARPYAPETAVVRRRKSLSLQHTDQ